MQTVARLYKTSSTWASMRGNSSVFAVCQSTRLLVSVNDYLEVRRVHLMKWILYFSALVRSLPEHGTYTNVIAPGTHVESPQLDPGWYEELQFTRSTHMYKDLDQNNG